MLDVYNMTQAAAKMEVTRACLSLWRKEGRGPIGFTLVDTPRAAVYYLKAEIHRWIAQRAVGRAV